MSPRRRDDHLGEPAPWPYESQLHRTRTGRQTAAIWIGATVALGSVAAGLWAFDRWVAPIVAGWIVG